MIEPIMIKAGGRAADRLSPALADIAAIVGWRLPDWDIAIRQARRSGLLARLANLIADAGLDPAVPPRARGHLEAAQILARKHAGDVARELDYIGEALEGIGAKAI